jgi:Zn-dependent protease
MRSWSIPAGRLFGVDIRIHLTFLFLLVFVWFTQSVALGTAGAMRGLALVAIIFLCVVLHELGHALVAQRSGVAVRSIILLPIGGVTLMEDMGQRTPDSARDIRISIAGPLVNLAIAAVSGVVILLFLPQVNLWSRPLVNAANLPRALFWGNVFLGGFNLLPAYPMDGGRVLRALFAERMEYVRATRLAVTIGQGFAMLFIFLGVWNPWLMLIGFFLFVGAQLEDRSVVFQSVLESVRMEDVMLTGFSTLSPADTLEDALHKPCTRCKMTSLSFAAATWWASSASNVLWTRCAAAATAMCSRPWCAPSTLRRAPIRWLLPFASSAGRAST